MNSNTANADPVPAPVSYRARAFGWSLAICSVVNALLVVAKEESPKLQDRMKAISGHHWITHAFVIVILFVALGLLLGPVAKKHTPRRTAGSPAMLVVAGIVVGAAVIVGFYLFAD